MKIKEATRLTGKSRTSILRALNDGKISGEKDASGVWDIQPVDLLKYYSIEPSRLEEQVSADTERTPVRGAPRTPDGAQGEHPSNQEISVENAELKAELKVSRQLLDDRGRTIEHLRSELADEKQERREAQTKLTALLTDQRQSAPEEPVQARGTHWGYWAALFIALGLVAAFVAILSVPELFTAVAASLGTTG